MKGAGKEIVCNNLNTHLDATKLFLNHAALGLSHTLNLFYFPFLHINHSVPELSLSPLFIYVHFFFGSALFNGDIMMMMITGA